MSFAALNGAKGRLAGSLCGVLILSACGGGGGESSVPLIGAAVTNTGGLIVTQTTATGSRTESGAITVTTDSGTFRSSGGPDGNGVYTATNGDTAQLVQDNLIGGDYDFVSALDITQGGANSRAIVGRAASSTSLNAAAGTTVTYTGEAAITTAAGANIVQHGSNTATITADFATSTVDVSITGASAVGGDVTQVDTVTITGATISDATFSGGTLAATLGGSDVLPGIVGASPTTDVDGAFFGSAADGPAEVGGVALVNGSTGSLSTIFVGDR